MSLLSSMTNSVPNLLEREAARIVVFHQGALGDFLLTVPIVEELCAAWPGSGIASGGAKVLIDFWAKPEYVSLLEGKRYLGASYSVHGPLVSALFRDDLWQSVPLPDFLLNAHHVFIFGQSGSQLLSERLSVRLNGRVDWVRSFPLPDSPRVHVSDFLRQQVKELGFELREMPWSLDPPSRALQASARQLEDWGGSEKPVLVHPGSGGKRKVWPLANWSALLCWLKEDLHLPVLLSVGPADEYLEDFAIAMARADVRVVSGLSTLELAALLSHCRLYVGSDSGVSHLAAAVGLSTVAVFGPSDPAIWAPGGRSVRVLQRAWSDSETLLWDHSGCAGFADKEMRGIIMGFIRAL
jgi:ADP-heptose:LPS heptosyltransferase